jgi:hypothetical protein
MVCISCWYVTCNTERSLQTPKSPTSRGLRGRDKDPRGHAIRLRREGPTGDFGAVKTLRWSFRFFCQILIEAERELGAPGADPVK